MNVRRLLVAASAVAILAGTSVAASAGSHSFSKGSSSSGVVSVGTVWGGTPFAITLQHEKTNSIAKGGWSGASADAGTSGNAAASIVVTHTDTIQPYSAPGYAPIGGQQGGSSQTVSVSAAGTTYGSSSAGN